MKADLSRTTFDRLKHFSRVVAQQGRVQLDADWNEQASLMLYQLRRLAADVIGPAGGPAGNLGFGLGALDAPAAAGVPDFAIGAGHYYVQGILCELEATRLPASFVDAGSKVRLPELSVDGRCFRAHQYVSLADAEPGSTVAPVQARIVDVDEGARILTLTDIGGFIRSNPRQPRLSRLTTFLTQPDGTPGPVAAGNFEQGPSLVYLDVWERLVTALEDDFIREVALGGPDTSARTRLVWQVAVLPLRDSAGLTPDQLRERLQPVNRGRLGPARPDIAARRTISIASRSTTAAPAARRRSNGRATTARSSGPSPAATATRSSWRRSSLTIAAAWRQATGWKSRTTIRCWRIAPFPCCVSAPSIPATAASCCPATFRPASAATLPGIRCCGAGTTRRRSRPRRAGRKAGWNWKTEWKSSSSIRSELVYRTGDYWLIPARVATGDVEWPREALSAGAARRPLARLPAGVNHHYAPLGVVEWDGRTLSFGRDCRLQFSGAGPLAPRR